MRPFAGRRVLLVVSGSIAAYKAVSLLRRLTGAGATVDVVLTRAAQRFVGPLTFRSLTEGRVLGDLWTDPLAHVSLGREADVALVAPATADLLARMSGGRADDLAAATLLAAACPVLACPAMNGRMWRHPATRENVRRLAERGIRILPPEQGELAEGEDDVGRLAAEEAILAEVGRLLEPESPLRGRRVVVTAGPTRAALDPVRFVGNRSSGRMGYSLAASAWRRGAEVVLVSGPATVPPPHGPQLVGVERSEEMLEALCEALSSADVLLMAAAVGDFEPERPSEEKIKKEGRKELELRLRVGPDLLGETRELRETRGVRTLGFALETENGVANARAKLGDKGLDLVALNEAGRPDSGFDAATNRVTIVGRDGDVEELPLLPKDEVADRLLDRLEDLLRE